MDAAENYAQMNESTHQTKFNRLTLAFVLVGGIAIAGWLIASQTSLLQNFIAKFTGPPQVTLTESFNNESETTFDHSRFHQILQAHVDADGWVDYAAIQSNQASLDAYLESLKNADVESLGRDERLAFLINSYNAFTLKLIVERYPIDSIKDIAAADRWDAVRWNLAGNLVSLNQIEHDLIRPNFAEPRIHFALVCAAIGCPPLRNEAFNGQSLESQLAAQTDYVHDHETWLSHDKRRNRIKLTRLYKWYGNDFVQKSGSVLQFVQSHSANIAEGDSPRIGWLTYDWSLNDVTKKVER